MYLGNDRELFLRVKSQEGAQPLDQPRFYRAQDWLGQCAELDLVLNMCRCQNPGVLSKLRPDLPPLSLSIRALIDVGRLSEGQSILLQSPASTVGHAALLTARAVGAEIYIIAESEVEAQYLMATYGFPKERVYQAIVNFPTAQLIQDTEGHGLTVGSTPDTREDFEMAAAGKDTSRPAHSFTSCLQNRSRVPVSHNEWADRKPTITVLDDLSKIEATAKRRTLSLDTEAVYLLTGGFGGLGMALVNELVERGVRTLVIISRSADQTDESKKFVVEMASLGCSIVPVSGKVNSQEDVERAIAKVGRPIKGVVHMAWILHNALINEPLEFFSLTSSLFTAIEHPGQGNYNSANTFLEAFCQYRHHLGLPAWVLNICPIDGVGFFATNSVKKKKMEAQGFYFLGEQAFLDFAELFILNSSPPSVNWRIDAWSAWRNSRQTFMGLRSELHLDDPKNRASWRRDRRMALYHNLKAFSGGEH
ncbi:MAG: hypothetical protein Q9161_005215 [Pseudevernia consocians]